MVAAQRFAERGQLDKALIELGKVVQEDPKDTRTWLKMAELHAKRGAPAEAAEIYARTGDLYAEQGFTQKAVAVYKNVLKLSPTTVSAHQKLGMIFMQLGLVSDAVQQFELAAVGFQQGGRFPEAVASLRLAAELQPHNVVLRVNLAESASQAGLTEEAVREFGVAADALKASGRTDEYIRVCERLLFHRPDDVERARELAEIYIARGSPRLALPKLQMCLRLDVRDPITLSLLARALEQLGQKGKAVSVIKELVRLFEELGREPERDAAVLRGLTLDPGDADLQALASQHHLRGSVQPTPSPLWGRPPSPDIGVAASVPIPPTASGRVAVTLDGGGFGVSGPREGQVQVSVPNGDFATSSPDIIRILAESEVFVKYELLDRAASNLRRVFQIDPLHRPARERLTEVLVDLGRHADAARESLILAEQLARSDRAEARRLAERALGLDPTNGEAAALVHQLGGGGSVVVGAAAPSHAPPPGGPEPAAGPFGVFVPGRVVFLDDLELEDPRAWKLDDDDLELDPNQDLLTPPLLGIDGRGSVSLGVTAEIMLPGRAPGGTRSDRPVFPTFDVDPESDPGAGSTLEVEGGGDGSGAEGEIAFELDVGTSDLLAVDLVDALEADATPPPEVDGLDGEGDDLTPILTLPPRHPDSSAFELDDTLAGRPPRDLDGPVSAWGRSPPPAVEVSRPERVEADVETAIENEHEAVLAGLIAASAIPDRERLQVQVQVQAQPQAIDDQELGAELEQVSFFIDQGMFDDARTLLDELGTRFGRARRLVEMEEELEAARHPATRDAPEGRSSRQSRQERQRQEDDDDDVATTVIRTEEPADPGESYLHLGLYDAAIEEYKKLARDPVREVFALTRMGDSYQAKGSFTEAILRYKRALNCDHVTREEARLLYFQLGMTFERLGDISEALYFFEKVAKRDPGFREVSRKVAELIPRKVKRA
jgi:pilus assembly protein FimV